MTNKCTLLYNVSNEEGDDFVKIIKYQKKKLGKYVIELEGGEEIETYEDLILKYDLLIKKEISLELLEKIREENVMYEVYFVALKYIKVKMRSVYELKKYLLKKEYPSEKIDDAIVLLKKQGYLNDEAYAKSFLHDRIAFSTDGPLKIKQEFEKLELSEEQIKEILSEYQEELELERIEKLIQKQIRSNHTKSNYSLKQKIYQNLLTLGYHPSLIEEKLSFVEQGEEEEEKIYQKEYQKLYRKLSRKYSGTELEYQMRQKLFQKGFRQNR